MSDVLSEEQVAEALSDLPEWSGDAEQLRRTIEFQDFPTAIRAVAQVADVAESMDHHPDIDIRWRTLTFTLSTHSAGGVTALDLDLARRISEVAAGLR